MPETLVNGKQNIQERKIMPFEAMKTFMASKQNFKTHFGFI